MLTAIADVLSDLATYDGPPDWAHVRERAAAAAFAVLVVYIKKQLDVKKALYTPVPEEGEPPSLVSLIPPPPPDERQGRG
jgi:hypothetical protein